MTTEHNINLKDAKARLSELVSRAEAGEETTITRHGKPVARVSAARHELQPIDIERLRALTDSLPAQRQEAGEAIRAIRDQARY